MWARLQSFLFSVHLALGLEETEYKTYNHIWLHKDICVYKILTLFVALQTIISTLIILWLIESEMEFNYSTPTFFKSLQHYSGRLPLILCCITLP